MNDPEEYSKNLGQFVDVARILFQKHKHHLKWSDEESILDLGIGDGIIAQEVIIPILPENCKEYVGCDISVNMLKSSEKSVSLRNFATIQMDATTENLHYEVRNRFHHIFANYLFHHVPNIR